MNTSPRAGVVERGGCLLHYWLSGPDDAPLLVMTHGATLDHHMFDPQLTALTDNYRVLTWDMRGHGKSQPMGEAFTVPCAVDDLLAILNHIDVKQAVFAGQSTGGYVVQELVFRHPERVQAVIMIDCTCITFKLSWLENLALASTPMLLRLYPLNMLNKQSAKASAVRPEVQDYYLEAASQISKRDLITIWTGIVKCIHAEPEYRMNKPMLLVHGEFDKLGNIAKIAPQWAELESQCTYVVIPQASHLANMDNPQVFNRTMLDFLDHNTR
jgi:3-oxoadipate enol-lactonase